MIINAREQEKKKKKKETKTIDCISGRVKYY
jgi:hypothetical protein